MFRSERQYGSDLSVLDAEGSSELLGAFGHRGEPDAGGPGSAGGAVVSHRYVQGVVEDVEGD